MQSNADKDMRDKLNGLDFPFDPEAWAKMETMLDKKKKRRGFFWWWFGSGVAAGVVLTAGFFLTQHNSTNVEESPVIAGNQKNSQTELISSKLKRNESLKNNIEPLVAGQTKRTKTQHLENSEGVKERHSISSGNQTKNAIGSTYSASLAKNYSQTNQVTPEPFSTTNSNNNNSAVADYSFSEFLVAQSELKEIKEETIPINSLDGLLSLEENYGEPTKVEEDKLPKPKKKLFNYSLGALSGMSASTVGAQSALTGTKAPLFHNYPSFSAGLTHQVTFIDRIAISNSILYAQTGFTYYQPNSAADSLSKVLSYKAAISELQVPIGLKFYPVVKPWFRFNVGAGIINHIKLYELFSIEKMYTPPANIGLGNDPTFDVTNSSNPFTQVEPKAVNLYNQQEELYPTQDAEYYGLGGLKRYYASFYTSLGFEFIAQQRWVFFAEPTFFMSLSKIGKQDNHKYNLGANAGFRYQF